MKSTTRQALVGTVTLAIVASGTYFAWAQWTIPASVTAKAKTVKMPKGVAASAANQSGKAVVSWSAQEIVPGVKMQNYIVTAHDTDTPALPDVAHTVSASGASSETEIFTATELAGGKWKFAITPKFELWIGPEGKLSSPKLPFAALAPSAALAKIAESPASQATTPTPTPTVSESTIPAATATTPAPEEPTGPPRADPTTSATRNDPEPAKTESAKADPAPSERPSAVDPLPVESAE